jgi:uncharacterized protein YktB (UPF0637 family)
MFPKNILKRDLKYLSNTIKSYKNSFAKRQRNYSNLTEYVQWSHGQKSPHKYFYSDLEHLKTYQKRYRYLHIAYCLLRGKDYTTIERCTSEDKKIDINLLNDVFKEFCKINKINYMPIFQINNKADSLDIKVYNYWKFISSEEQI